MHLDKLSGCRSKRMTHQMRWIQTLTATVLVVLTGISQVHPAGHATATPEGALTETFDEAPQSSGIPMVGLRLVTDDGDVYTSGINLSDIVVAVPSEFVNRICVRVTTQDARYLALNPYLINDIQTDAPRARLEPISNRYLDELRRYSESEVAIKTYIVNDESCNPISALHLPRIRISNLTPTKAQTLEVRVNSRGRDVEAMLGLRKSETVADQTITSQYSVTCANTQNRAGLAFDRLCQFHFVDYSLVAGTIWTLTLALNDGFADSLHDYAVYLP